MRPVAAKLALWSITAPIAMMVAGIALTSGSDPPLVFDFGDLVSFERAVEVVLALLLFVDATEVPAGAIRRSGASSPGSSAARCR